ncbi:hypothetical protein OL548_08110 [Lysinibacillus sp. MHQ-1]|nr:hypothetical protein OL548_08110 [Lysinibacillus sp. MHQ-1]
MQPFIQHTERLQQLEGNFLIEAVPEESVEYLKILTGQLRESLQEANQQLEQVEKARVQLVPKQASLQTVQTSLQEVDLLLSQMEERLKEINVAGLKKRKATSHLHEAIAVDTRTHSRRG